MNKKNHEKIAEIIKIRKEKFSKCNKPSFDSDSYIMACEEIAKDLADYFEKEDECIICKKCGVEKKEHDTFDFEGDFNKKQFLKKVGVQE